MSSSTSSSEAIGAAIAAPGRATRIALVLLLVLGGVEALTRLKLVGMSKEFEQFRSYPRLATDLAHRSGLRLAIVGASDRKSTRLNSSHVSISYAVFCLKKK